MWAATDDAPHKKCTRTEHSHLSEIFDLSRPRGRNEVKIFYEHEEIFRCLPPLTSHIIPRSKEKEEQDDPNKLSILLRIVGQL